MSKIVDPKGKGVGYRVTSQTIEGPDGQNNVIREVGRRLRPEDGHEYAGSIAIHLYKNPANKSVQVRTQDCLPMDVTAMEANWALQQASAAIAKAYGHTPPKKREDVLRKEE